MQPHLPPVLTSLLFRWIVPPLLAAACPGAVAGIEIGFLDCMTRPPRSGEAALLTSGRIEAARGEWEPLQVVLRGHGRELAQATLEVAAPERANGGGKLGEWALFRGDYVRVVKSTEFAPLPPGDYVDPLVPLAGGGPLIAAKAAQETGSGLLNQPVWVDFRVPDNAEPGLYRGEIRLRGAGGAELGRAAFEVQVWDFALPPGPTLKSSIGMDPERIAKIYHLQKGTRRFNLLCRQYEDMLADHRLSPEGFWGSLEVFDGDRGLASLDLEGLPGLGTPGEVFRHFFEDKHLRNGSVAFWSDWPLPDGLGKDRETALRMLSQLGREFEKRGWADRIAVNCGAVDEPDSRKDYDEVRRYGAFFNELEKRHGVRLPMYVTEQPAPESWWWGSLRGYVDIYVTHVSDLWEDAEGRRSRAVEARLRDGDEIWMYPAMVQVPDGWLRAHGMPRALSGGNPPAWILDFPPMNHRIFAWAAPLHGVTGILYWDTVEWRDGIDPWERADTFQLEGDIYNGDGLLLYPGFRDRHGFEGPVPSVRLKWIREAMEDHAYLSLLRDRGEENWAHQQVRRICRGIGDWAAAPEKLFEVRRDLARRLSEHPAAS